MERILWLTWDPRALRIRISLTLFIRWFLSRLGLAFVPITHTCYWYNIDFSSTRRSSWAGSGLVVYIFLWVTRLTTSEANCLTSPTQKLILWILTFNLFSKWPGRSSLLLLILNLWKLFGSEIIIILLRWNLLDRSLRHILMIVKVLRNFRLAKRYVVLRVIFIVLDFGVPVLLHLVLMVIRIVWWLLLHRVKVIRIDVFRLKGLSLMWNIPSVDGCKIIFHVGTICTPILQIRVI